jgi:hypothetical protein
MDDAWSTEVSVRTCILSNSANKLTNSEIFVYKTRILFSETGVDFFLLPSFFLLSNLYVESKDGKIVLRR